MSRQGVGGNKSLESKPHHEHLSLLETKTAFTLREVGITAPTAEVSLMERELMEEPYYLSIYLKYNPKYEIRGLKRQSRTFIIQVRCLRALHGSVLWCSYSLVGTGLQQSAHVGRGHSHLRGMPLGKLSRSDHQHRQIPSLNNQNPLNGTSAILFSAHQPQVFRIILEAIVASFVKTGSPKLSVM